MSLKQLRPIFFFSPDEDSLISNDSDEGKPQVTGQDHSRVPVTAGGQRSSKKSQWNTAI